MANIPQPPVASGGSSAPSAILSRVDLSLLIGALRARGYQVVGPTLRDGAIVYDTIESDADLPIGWKDVQDAGRYRLERRRDQAVFGYAVGPQSWKRFLFPPRQKLWEASRDSDGFTIQEHQDEPVRYAFLGVRSCELHAIAVQDKVFMGGAQVDRAYALRREQAFFVAVQCAEAGGTCFCVSMKTGPRATSGFDLALTEVIESDRHHFVVEAGTRAGEEVLSTLPHRPSEGDEVREALAISERTASQMGRSLDMEGLKELLYRNLEHPRWDEVASRCLSCTSCTMVCPTCFCSTVEDVNDLSLEKAERWRQWDSCFNVDFSYIHGGSARPSVPARYRQWMTHKLATWQDQFGTPGCVGCGRCVTWCPVGIDITEEARVIREQDGADKNTSK